MAEHFDPYHKWLGISPQNQPPDLYRLLALERFEEDLEVIEAAANRQMTYVQSCATGPYVEHSQKLLNEIAAARLCLLDLRRKAEYDAVLRDKIGRSQRTARLAAVAVPGGDEALTGTLPNMEETLAPEQFSAAVARGAPVPPPAPPRPRHSCPPGEVIAVHGESSTRPMRRPQRRRKQPLGTLLVLGILAVGVVGVGTYLLLKPPDDRRRAISTTLGNRDVTSPSKPAKPSLTDKPVIAVRPKKLDNDGGIVPPGSTNTKLPDPEAPANVPAAADTAALFHQGEEALSRRDLNAAVEALKKVAENPRSPQREQAQALLVQIATVTANDWARQQLSQLDNPGLEAFAQRKIQFQMGGVHPALVSVAHETLYRNLPEVMKARGLAPPPGAPPPPGQPPPAPPANQPAQRPPAAAPKGPAELLQFRGLKRVWKTWVHNDEARCMELMGTIQEAEKRRQELSKELSAAKKKIESAKRSLERDEAAVKRAETSGKPASGTPEHDKLTDRATESRDAVTAAEADFQSLKEASAEAGKKANDALAEARRLASGLDEKYRQLTADAQVQEALAQLDQQLGPSDEFKQMRGELNRARP